MGLARVGRATPQLGLTSFRSESRRSGCPNLSRTGFWVDLVFCSPQDPRRGWIKKINQTMDRLGHM